MLPVISRDDAVAAGLKRFYTGEPCGRGHVAERYIKGLCIECHQIQGAARYLIRRDEILGNQKARREANPDHVRGIERASYERHSEQKIASCEIWWKNNPEKRAAKALRRYHTPAGNLNSRIGRRMNECLASGKGGKSWTELVPYGLNELRRHIERQFTKGMGWHNRHLWHIDHIIPLSSFKFTLPSDPEFQAAWALTNLRPLWKEINLSKRDKRTLLI